MKKRGFSLIYIIIILSFLTIAYADTLPIYVRPLSGGSIQASTAFDYQFNFTSDQSCSTVLHSVTRTITTDKYGVGFAEIDISSLNETPSYICEYRAASGNSLSLRKVHNINSGLFNRTFGKDTHLEGDINTTGNVTLAQKIIFSLGSVLKEVTGWLVFSKGISVEGDLNVTGDMNVSGYVNASTIYSGGKNVTTLADYAYNQTEPSQTYTDTASTNLQSNITDLNSTYNELWYNYTGTGDYYYNQSSDYDFYNQSTATTTMHNNSWSSSYNETYDKYAYNMSDGSYNETYDKYAYNMSDGSYNETYDKYAYNQTITEIDNLNVTVTLNVTEELFTSGNITLAQRITFNLGNIIKEISNWFITTASVAIQGDLNVTGDMNVSGYVNASTIYSGGKNVTTLADYAYNQTYTDGTYNETYHGLNVSYYKYWYNYTGTGDYYYNQTAAVEDNFVNNTGDNMTGNLTIGIKQAPGSGIYFGDNYNASIYWNGSNLIIQG